MWYGFLDKQPYRKACLSADPYHTVGGEMRYVFLDKASGVNRFSLSADTDHFARASLWYGFLDKHPSR